ncbi:hypothetical protein BHE74_00040747 [Ensete ventricosum]|nr:hypothetical protein BHE74_00040747 [Ensete ventricosum]
MEATTNNNIELLLPNRVSYIRNLSYASNKLKSLQSYLKWMCVNQFDAMHAMVFFVPLHPMCFRPHHPLLCPLLCPHSLCLQRGGLVLPRLCL